MAKETQGQMSREELVEARKRVALQMDELTNPQTYRGLRPDAGLALRDELGSILQEIDSQLAEIGTKNA